MIETKLPFLSTPAIRQHFPALERTHSDQAVAYFDGPGGTQVPRAVVEAMTDYLYHHNANTHWAYPTSEETDAIIGNARQALADFLNATPNEIAFGANMTTLTFHLARALGRGYEPGDEIVITELDHHANVAPWRALEKERGVIVRLARMIPETGQLDWDHFSQQLNKRTKLIAIGAASNALGTINDVRRAAEMAHSLGAQIFVDAVHYAPHELVDVRGWNCDFRLLRLQVLRSAHRNSLRPGEPSGVARFSQAHSSARYRAGTSRNWHPESRRDRRRRRGGGFPARLSPSREVWKA